MLVTVKKRSCHALLHCRKTFVTAVAMASAATALCGTKEIEEKAATNVASGYVTAREKPRIYAIFGDRVILRLV